MRKGLVREGRVQQRTCMVNGVSYEVNMAGTGLPLLLLHGFTGNKESWHRFMHSWSDRYHLIAVDLLGHGATDAPPSATRYTMQHAVTDLCALLDQLHIERTAVLGYSMGGRLALSLAVQHPTRISALILESSSPGLALASERTARLEQDASLATAIEQKGLDWFVDYWGALPLFTTASTLSEDDRALLRQQRLNNRPQGLAHSLRGMGTGSQPSHWADLHHLTMPTLLITGELDVKFCRIAKQMCEQNDRFIHQPVANAGHLVHMEQAAMFDTIVMDFLSRQYE